MALQDLREFVSALEKRGQLKRIRAEVDAELEIAEITDRLAVRKCSRPLDSRAHKRAGQPRANDDRAWGERLWRDNRAYQ